MTAPDNAYAIEVEVGPESGAPLADEWLARIVAIVLQQQGVDPPAEIGLLVTDDAAVQQLNRDYRGLDEPTDVLAFALEEDAAPDQGFVTPPDGVRHLGEVILSYPRAVEQARTARHPTEREVALLVVHGVLHLLGHDHAEPEETALMRAAEQAALAVVFA